jgi:hypothetical protein
VKVTPQIAEALANLRGNRDFKAVLEGMQEHEREATQQCIDGDGPVQLRASGAVKALQWWKNAFASAPADFEKFKNQAQSQQQQNR